MAIESAIDTLKIPEGKAGGTFGISITLTNPDVIKGWLKLGVDFQKTGETTFSNFIYEVHKYLIRITPIDTGELRGGWTAYLDRANIDYSRQILDTSIAVKAAGRQYHITPDGVQEGRGYSQYEAPTPLDVTIINNVPYGYYLDQGTSKIASRNFVEDARYKAELWFEKTFGSWFDKIGANQAIVPPDPAEEIPA